MLPHRLLRVFESVAVTNIARGSTLNGLREASVCARHHAAHLRRSSTRKVDRRRDVITFWTPMRLPRLHLHREWREGGRVGEQGFPGRRRRQSSHAYRCGDAYTLANMERNSELCLEPRYPHVCMHTRVLFVAASTLCRLLGAPAALRARLDRLLLHLRLCQGNRAQNVRERSSAQLHP